MPRTAKRSGCARCSPSRPASTAGLSNGSNAAQRRARCSAMRRVNPAFIPRNHRVEAAIEAALGGDFAPFEQLHSALARPYDDQPAFAGYAEPPQPEERITADVLRHVRVPLLQIDVSSRVRVSLVSQAHYSGVAQYRHPLMESTSSDPLRQIEVSARSSTSRTSVRQAPLSPIGSSSSNRGADPQQLVIWTVGPERSLQISDGYVGKQRPKRPTGGGRKDDGRNRP